MFGISFPELLVVVVLLLAVTSPKEIPGIARYLAKLFFKAKQFVAHAKSEVAKIGDDFGLEKIKEEAEAEIKKNKDEIKKTIIVDLYGNEHEVCDVEKIRGDLAKEDLQKEIEKFNKVNEKSRKPKTKQASKRSKKS